MSKRMKCAVIGCGAIGNTHTERYVKSAYADLACLVDIERSKAEALAARCNVPAVLTDYRKILKDPSIQAVSVCLPNYLHAPVSIDCLRAGKHVLCEKPIALNARQAQAMQAAAKRSRRLLAIGVVNRYSDNVNCIRKMIAAGDLGDVYHVNAVFKAHRSIPGLGGWFTNRAKSGGGVLIDWGVHFLDLILYCLGNPRPTTMSGAAYSKLGANPREYAYISMWAGPPKLDGVCNVEEYASGLLRTSAATVAFEGAWAQNIGDAAMYIEFLGDRAGIRLTYGGGFVVYGHKEGALYKTEPSLRAGDMFQTEIDTFLQCAATGRKCPSEISTVLSTQRVLDAFYRSAKLKREVRV